MSKSYYVNVLGHKIKVKEVKGFSGNPSQVGRFYEEPEMLIEVLESLDKKAKRKTLFHEMIHAGIFLSGLGGGINYDLNEQITYFFELNGEKILKESQKVYGE